MTKILENLSTRQRITIAIVTIAVGAGLYSLVQWRKETDFHPLFTGLSSEDANGIVQKLKESGVEYRLPEGGGTVLVPSSKLADARLTMAGIGLPKSGRIGFELFDKVNLGATEFTEHINYRRALEGELERTVMALAEVETARVHLTFPKDSVFLEAQQPAKASVLIRIRPGARLAPQNVVAITHLVGSAVEGLSPDAVSVLDMNGNLLNRPKQAALGDGSEPSAATLDYRHQVETEVLAKIYATLSPLLGAEKFRAGVSVECDFTGGEQSEEIFDPAHSVMVSSQRTDDSTGGASAAGVPGTASTLPRPASRPSTGSNKSVRTTENVIYQSSRTVKKTRLPAGTLRKMSLAVLVDQDVTWEKDKNAYKRVLVPPSPEKLKVIRDLVAGITGFSQERGDQLVIETLPFETTLLLEPPGQPASAAPAKPGSPISGLPFPVNQKTLMIGGGALAGVIVLGILFAVRRKRSKKSGSVEMPGQSNLPGGHQLPASISPVKSAAHAAALSASSNVESQFESQLAERDALQAQMDAQTLSSLKLAPVITKKAEVLAKHLREKIAKEPDISVQVLRTWIREDEG
ncbi:MAG: flagellar M-ring protein FliF [Candidatus Solibacter sp.]|jgi:flagellar M-ring protein FliF|nr:flagellar M-ring protein FliF [Candidatus Solibacter sp.]